VYAFFPLGFIFLYSDCSEFCNLPDVVNHAEEFPLNDHLLFTSEGESIQTYGIADVREKRLNSSHSSAVDVPYLYQ